jgi:hypothetical protein
MKGDKPVATTTKHPNITVNLSDCDGNTLSIIGRCCRVARQAGVSEAEIAAFRKEATSGDYDNVLATAFRWFDIV